MCRQDLALTDPALYQALRNGVTRFHLRGGGKLRLERLEQLAREETAAHG